MTDKQELRHRIRGSFPGQAERDAQSRAICRHIEQWAEWIQARTVGLYIPMPREADVLPLMAAAWREGKRVILPRVEGPGQMTLREITAQEQLVEGAYHIPEPRADAPKAALGDIDLLLVPLEALDARGVRLGKGGGYYDRILPHVHCTTVGIVLEHQWVQQVPRDPWDRSLTCAADVNGIIYF